MRKRFNIFLIIFTSALLFSCASNSLNLREGINSFQLQNYRDAFIKLKPAAMQGQVDAQYAVGYMYYYGQGVVENRKKAWYWISLAASAGQPDAIEAMKILER